MVENNIEVGFYLDYLFESERVILTEGIVDSRIIPAYKRNIDLIKKFLTHHNVNLDKVHAETRNVYRQLESKMLRRVEPVKVASWLNRKITAIIYEIIGPPSANPDLSEKIVRSLRLVLIVVIAQLLVEMMIGGPLLGGLMGASTATAFMAIVIAPITEEALKKVGILEGYPFLMTGIFAGIEAMEYIAMMIAAGTPLLTAVVVRAALVVFHFCTMLIQKYFHRKGVELQSTKLDTMGYIMAVVTHASWNTIAVLMRG